MATHGGPETFRTAGDRLILVEETAHKHGVESLAYQTAVQVCPPPRPRPSPSPTRHRHHPNRHVMAAGVSFLTSVEPATLFWSRDAGNLIMLCPTWYHNLTPGPTPGLAMVIRLTLSNAAFDELPAGAALAQGLAACCRCSYRQPHPNVAPLLANEFLERWIKP